MTRGVGLLAGLCLIATACSGNTTPPVLVEVVPPPARGFYDELPDAMIPIVLPTTEAEVAAAVAPSAPAPTSGSTSAAVTISQAASPPPPDPKVASTPRPAPPKPTAVPKTPTPVVTPVAPANCPSAQHLTEGDNLVRAAQTLPAVFYGGGLCSGDKVEASIGGAVCGTATVNTAGQWSISIRATASCGPTEGATVALSVNGKASGSATWKNSGLPPDVANGYSLSR